MRRMNCSHKMIAVLMLFSLFEAYSPPAQAQEASEYSIKAALLFNFAKFVQWPDDAFEGSDAPFVMGVLGDDPFGESLNVLKDKTVRNRKLAVKRYKRIVDIKKCHILFVGSSEKDRLEEILKSLGNQSILTVGELESFIEFGGIIGLITVNDNIRFEVNATAAKSSNLKISSQLLKVASKVKVD